MEITIYNNIQYEVLKDIANENLCFIVLKETGYTSKQIKYNIYFIKTIGKLSYISDTYFSYLKWVKYEYPYHK